MESREARVANIFLAHQGYIMGLAVKHAPWPGAADDIVQQVFVEFYSKAAQWDLDADLRPLLAGMTRLVTRRVWRDRRRGMSKVMQELADHVQSLTEQESDARFEEELPILRQCMEKLPEKSRTLIEMYYYAGFPVAEIALRIGAKADTVCRAISRLREKLRDCIDRARTEETHQEQGYA